MRRLVFLAALVLATIAAPTATAATATPFGGATVTGGVLTLVSNTGDAVTTNDYSGAGFADTGVTTFASLTTLSAEFDVTDDDCKAGSPRFSVTVRTPSGPRSVFVYLGPASSFSGCAPNAWTSTGNLIGAGDGRFDISQIVSGGQASTYTQAVAAVGTYPVTSISLVVDSGWAFDDKEQTVRVRTVKVNASTFYAPTTTPPTTGGMSPAQACRALRTTMGAEAFRTAFGTNRTNANAFGKCVSSMARLKSDTARTTAVTAIAVKAKSCTTTGKAKGSKAAAKAKKHDKRRVACLEKLT